MPRKLAALLVLIGAPAHAQDALVARLDTQVPGTTSLLDERIVVAIDRQHASTTLRQTYHNRSNAEVEGRFWLRTAQGGRIEGFSYWNGEQRIVGEVLERSAAQQIYAETTNQRRDPGILEAEGEGSFRFRVFPIAPGEEKRIEVSFAQWLVRRSGWIEYRSPVGGRNANIEVGIEDPRGIGEVECPSHHIQLEHIDAGRVRIRARQLKENHRAEIVLRYRLHDPPWQLTAAVHQDPGHPGYFVATVATPAGLEAQVAPKDVTLVLDVSGSMGGEPIERARDAALDIVARLKPEDRVNVISFDDGASPLFSVPRSLEREAREAAIDFIRNLRSGGGTNIAGALERALLSQDPVSRRTSTVMLFTDGKSDAAASLRVARSLGEGIRVFTIGVGPGVNRELLSRLAAEKGGRFTFIESATALRQRTDDLFRQIESPVLISPTLEVDGALVSYVYPQTLPDLFLHDELRIVGRIRGESTATLVLRGVIAGEPVEMRADIALLPQTRRWVGRLWAEARVSHLLEELQLGGSAEELEPEVIELALAYRFVTPYTAFLAMPEQELTASTAASLRLARAQVAAAMSQNPDAIALHSSATHPSVDDGIAGAPPMPEEEYDEDLVLHAPHPSSAGCASCRVGGGDSRHALVPLLVLLALNRRCRTAATNESSARARRNRASCP